MLTAPLYFLFTQLKAMQRRVLMRVIYKPLAILLFTIAILSPKVTVSHPLKLSASLIEYDHKDKTIRMECKVFMDDFELSLSRSVLKGIDPSTLKRENKPRIIEEYFKKFYHISVNGKRVPLKYKLATPLYRQKVLIIEFAKFHLPLKEGDSLHIKNSIFFQDFGSAQTNRIIVRIPSFSIDKGHLATIDNHTFAHTLGAYK